MLACIEQSGMLKWWILFLVKASDISWKKCSFSAVILSPLKTLCHQSLFSEVNLRLWYSTVEFPHWYHGAITQCITINTTRLRYLDQSSQNDLRKCHFPLRQPGNCWVKSTPICGWIIQCISIKDTSSLCDLEQLSETDPYQKRSRCDDAFVYEERLSVCL